ncbi:MAG: hypothetical protein R3C99_17610 [Pirellulaceae bacterium]
MIEDKTEIATTADKAPNRWGYLLLLVIAIGSRHRYSSSRNIGTHYRLLGSLRILQNATALAVAFPVCFGASWIVNRERSEKRDDLAAMLYRPAIFPLWIFMIAAIKNFRDFGMPLPWIYLDCC